MGKEEGKEEIDREIHKQAPQRSALLAAALDQGGRSQALDRRTSNRMHGSVSGEFAVWA